MQRRYFEHLYMEICVALNQRLSRYDFWLLIWDGTGDPDRLTRRQARHFLENHLSLLLAKEGLSLSDRSRRRLERRILRFDPLHPTPEEWLASTFDQAEKRV